MQRRAEAKNNSRDAGSSGPRSIITYDGLPISSGGAHKIRSRDRESVWRRVKAFLETFADQTEPQRVRLLLYAGPSTDRAFVRTASATLSRDYGRAEQRLAVSGAGGTVVEYFWVLVERKIDAALALMRTLPPFPADPLGGPVVLSVSTRFLLRDPHTGSILPGQRHNLYGDQDASPGLKLGVSNLYLRLEGRSTCSLLLSLPWPEATPELREYVRNLEEALPFPLSRHHWARWQSIRQGSGYYKRRLEWTADAGGRRSV